MFGLYLIDSVAKFGAALGVAMLVGAFAMSSGVLAAVAVTELGLGFVASQK